VPHAARAPDDVARIQTSGVPREHLRNNLFLPLPARLPFFPYPNPFMFVLQNYQEALRNLGINILTNVNKSKNLFNHD
jgi:hypothetical protein